jgi:ABC-2 type transport system permease protein
VVEVADAAAAKAPPRAAEKAGAAALVTDLPAAWTLAAADAVKLPVLNLGAAADRAAWRRLPPHAVAPAAQRAHARRRAGPDPGGARWRRCCCWRPDAGRRRAQRRWRRQPLKRYGLKLVASKPFKLSADPRERDLANPLLLTQGGLRRGLGGRQRRRVRAHAALPHLLPRPVVGDGGLVARGLARAKFERFGAPQVTRRLPRRPGGRWARTTGRPGWPARRWSRRRGGAQGPSPPCQALAEDAELDGSKGVVMSFRPWDGQLRQPLLLGDGQASSRSGAGRRRAAPEERARHAGRRCAREAVQGAMSARRLPVWPPNRLGPIGRQAPCKRRMPHALQALWAIVQRELLKFGRQTGRLVSALVRPLLWLAVFAAGFRNVFGVAIVEPYDTYIPYDVYIAPGLIGMVLLFNGMQSSLAMVYDREMGLMRLLLTAPLPRWWILLSKLCATAVLSLLQALAFVVVAALLGTALPVFGAAHVRMLLLAAVWRADAGRAGPAAVGAHQAAGELRRHDELRHLPDVLHVHRALPAVEAGGVGRRAWVYQLARFNPFTHAVEWMRFALYGKDPGWSPWIVLGTLALCFGLAAGATTRSAASAR